MGVRLRAGPVGTKTWSQQPLQEDIQIQNDFQQPRLPAVPSQSGASQSCLSLTLRDVLGVRKGSSSILGAPVLPHYLSPGLG